MLVRQSKNTFIRFYDGKAFLTKRIHEEYEQLGLL